MTEPIDRTCLACGDEHGIPKAVTAERGTLVVTLACGTCGHQWAAERQADPDFLPRHTQQFQPA